MNILQQLKALESGPVAESWNEKVLHRIRVYRLSTVGQVLEYLLSIQGQDDTEIPSHGIIVDGIDEMLQAHRGSVNDRNSSNNSSYGPDEPDVGFHTTEQLQRMLQTGE